MFWICAEHKVDNKKMFLLLLSRAYPHPKAFSAFGTATLPEEAGGAWEVGRKHSWDR